jgi:RNA polymerase sigma factor (sigma-70 family)
VAGTAAVGTVGFVVTPMSTPDLQALRCGDPAAWDEAFAWLWPVAFAVARLKLAPFLPAEVEDVAIETLEELVDKVREVHDTGDLKPLAASIAHHRAVDRLRQHFAAKRGKGRTESLEQREEAANPAQAVTEENPLSLLGHKELAEKLRASLGALKPPMGEVLADFFLRGLSYEEIAKRRGIAMGSVGVYLKRGLEALRRTWGRGADS